MPFWAWAVIIAVAVGIVLAVVFAALTRRRTHRLRGQFGPEYERAVQSSSSRKDAETELMAREERHSKLDLRPLSPAARDRYMNEWQSVQAQFVDTPGTAVGVADTLIQSAMGERGYPVEDFEQRAADVSVDHPTVVEHYRAGHRLAQNAGAGDESTEELRQAMQHYRVLFEELVSPVDETALSRDGQVVGREESVR